MDKNALAFIRLKSNHIYNNWRQKLMVYDEKLAERIRELLKKKNDITEKKMFGGIAFFSNGKMFCGVIKNDLIIRTGKEHYEKALTKPYTRPMDFTGQAMKGFVYVSPMGCKTEKTLSEWVNLGIETVVSLGKQV
jgi:TfoX/Sxy family transcriptional regulator of competence genes